MKVIVHIGQQKTGTTALQSTFKQNEEELLRQGVLYDSSMVIGRARSGNSIGLAAACLTGEAREEFLSRYPGRKMVARFEDYDRSALEAHKNLRAVVFSSEHLSTAVREPEAVERLAGFLTSLGDTVTVVVYLKRHDRMAQSLYNQWSRRRTRMSPEVFRRQAVRIPTLYYAEMLETYQAVFGAENVIIRHGRRDGLIDGDIVADFADIAGLDTSRFGRPPRSNDSASFEALDLIGLVSDVSEGYGLPRGRLKRLKEEILKQGAGKAPIFTSVQAEKFLNRFKTEIRRIEKATGRKPFFDADFDDFPDTPPERSLKALRRLARKTGAGDFLKSALRLD